MRSSRGGVRQVGKSKRGLFCRRVETDANDASVCLLGQLHGGDERAVFLKRQPPTGLPGIGELHLYE